MSDSGSIAICEPVMRQCIGAQKRRAITSATSPSRVSTIISPARLIQNTLHAIRKTTWNTGSNGDRHIMRSSRGQAPLADDASRLHLFF